MIWANNIPNQNKYKEILSEELDRGEWGDGIWNSCHRALVCGETLLLAVTSRQHLDWQRIYSIRKGALQNTLSQTNYIIHDLLILASEKWQTNVKSCKDSLSVVFSFVLILYLCLLRTAFHLHEGRMQQVSAKWIYCRQHRCTYCLPQIVFSPRCGIASIFAKDLQNIMSLFKAHFFLPKCCVIFLPWGVFFLKRLRQLGLGIRPSRFWISEFARKRLNQRHI